MTSKAFLFLYIGNKKEKEYLPSSPSSLAISRRNRGRISVIPCQSSGNVGICSGLARKEPLLFHLAFILCSFYEHPQMLPLLRNFHLF